MAGRDRTLREKVQALLQRRACRELDDALAGRSGKDLRWHRYVDADGRGPVSAWARISRGEIWVTRIRKGVLIQLTDAQTGKTYPGSLFGTEGSTAWNKIEQSITRSGWPTPKVL